MERLAVAPSVAWLVRPTAVQMVDSKGDDWAVQWAVRKVALKGSLMEFAKVSQTAVP